MWSVISGVFSWVFEKFLEPFFSEKLRSARLQSQLKLGRKLLASDSDQRVDYGLGILFELAENFDYAKQEVIDLICELLRRRYSVNGPVRDGAMLVRTLSRLSRLKRVDCNDHPFYFALYRIHLESVDLRNLNLAHFTFYASDFHRVQFHRASFAHANLDGVHFLECYLEFVDFDGAQLGPCGPEDQGRTPVFERCELYASSIERATLVRPVAFLGVVGLPEQTLQRLRAAAS